MLLLGHVIAHRRVHLLDAKHFAVNSMRRAPILTPSFRVEPADGGLVKGRLELRPGFEDGHVFGSFWTMPLRT